MRSNHKILTIAFCLLYALYSDNFIYAQAKNASQPKTTNAPPTKAQAEIDSLNEVIMQVSASYQRAVNINNGKDSLIDELDAKIQKIQQLNGDLERKLKDYKGDNLKLDQSNRILIIFNAIVGVLLLTTLIWFLRNLGRRKPSPGNKLVASDESAAVSNTKAAPSKNDHQYFDLKLEQLEKLGVLKEKGVLNEEEFNR